MRSLICVLEGLGWGGWASTGAWRSSSLGRTDRGLTDHQPGPPVSARHLHWDVRTDLLAASQVTTAPQLSSFGGGSCRRALPFVAAVLRMRCGENPAPYEYLVHGEFSTGRMGAGKRGIGAWYKTVSAESLPLQSRVPPGGGEIGSLPTAMQCDDGPGKRSAFVLNPSSSRFAVAGVSYPGSLFSLLSQTRLGSVSLSFLHP